MRRRVRDRPPHGCYRRGDRTHAPARRSGRTALCMPRHIAPAAPGLNNPAACRSCPRFPSPPPAPAAPPALPPAAAHVGADRKPRHRGRARRARRRRVVAHGGAVAAGQRQRLPDRRRLRHRARRRAGGVPLSRPARAGAAGEHAARPAVGGRGPGGVPAAVAPGAARQLRHPVHCCSARSPRAATSCARSAPGRAAARCCCCCTSASRW